MSKIPRLILSVVLILGAALLATVGCTSGNGTDNTTATTTTGTTTTTRTTSNATTPTTRPPTTTPTANFTVNVASNATLGQYLTDNRGFTLYWTTLDQPGTSNLTEAQLIIWPPFYAPRINVPSSLNATDFRTFTRSNGDNQTTFKNWPLYYYVGDNKSGDTAGNRINNAWFIVSPNATAPSANSTTPGGGATNPPPSTTTAGAAQATTINLVAQNIAFNMQTITVPAGARVTVNFDNKDSGIPHNFSVYTNSSATMAIFTGEIINGPATTTYNFTAPSEPGNYYFRCDPHASIMNGAFIVQ